MFKILSSLLFATCFTWLSLSHGQSTPLSENDQNFLAYTLSDEVLKENQEVIKTITRKYSHKKYTYVFVGRSLSAMQLQMEVMGHKTLNLPLSGKDFFPYAPSSVMQNLNKKIITIVDEHLGHLLQNPRKQILLIDYSVSGGGMRAAKKILSHYFKNSIKVSSFEVMNGLDTTNFMQFKTFLKGDFIHILEPESRLGELIMNSAFDSFAKLPSFQINFGRFKGLPSEQTLQLRTAAKRWIRQQTSHKKLSKRCVSFVGK